MRWFFLVPIWWVFIVNVAAASDVLQFQYDYDKTYVYQSEGTVELWLNNAKVDTQPVVYELKLVGTRSLASRNSSKDGDEVQNLGFSIAYKKPFVLELKYTCKRKTNGESYDYSDAIYPSYRDIPTFPSEPIHENSYWKGLGVRVLDLTPYGIEKPYQYTFPIFYYVDSIQADRITIRYNFHEDHNFEFPFGKGSTDDFSKDKAENEFPVRIFGIHQGEMIFDTKERIIIQQKTTSSLVEILKDGTVRGSKLSQTTLLKK